MFLGAGDKTTGFIVLEILGEEEGGTVSGPVEGGTVLSQCSSVPDLSLRSSLGPE